MNNNQSAAVDGDAAVLVSNSSKNNNTVTSPPHNANRNQNDDSDSGRRRQRSTATPVEQFVLGSNNEDANAKKPKNTALIEASNHVPNKQPSLFLLATPQKNQDGLFSHDKVVLELDVKTVGAKNYIRRFERLATFSELIYNKMSGALGESQIPTFTHFRSAVQNFLSKKELDALKSAFKAQTNNMPSTPPPFPWSPLLLLLSRQYPTMESVPDSVVAFIINERNLKQTENGEDAASSLPNHFDEFASFSRRVAAFLLELPPAQHSQNDVIDIKIEEKFDDWFHSADANESKRFLVFMSRNVGAMLHRIGVGFTAPTSPTSFAALATCVSKNKINAEFSGIIHEGGELKDLIVLCEPATGAKFVARWREIAGGATIGIVCAEDSLRDSENLIQAASIQGKLVILSGPTGSGKSVAAFTLAESGVVAYIDARQVLPSGDLERAPQTRDNQIMERYLLRRNRNAVALLVEVLWKCLNDRMPLPERTMSAFRSSNFPLVDIAILELLKNVFGDWSTAQSSNTKFTMVIDEVRDYPIFVRACASVVKSFRTCVENFFKIENIAHLMVVGPGAENFDLNECIGSSPPLFTVLPIKPKNLLLHLLRHSATASSPKAIFFAKLFHLLFPNHECRNSATRYASVVSDAVGYRFLQLASNARCAVLLVKFFDMSFEDWVNTDKNNKNNHNHNSITDDDDAMTMAGKDAQRLWRLRAAAPRILQQVATAFVSLDGLALLQDDRAKNQEIATALGYSLNRVPNLTDQEWNRSAKTNGLTTDSARWTMSLYGKIAVCDPSTNLPLKSDSRDTYCFPENSPRYRIAEASVAVLLQRLDIGYEIANGVPVNARKWDLLEQLTFDFHCIRSLVPSTPEIDRQFDTLFSTQQCGETPNFRLTEAGHDTPATTRTATVGRLIWADPHVLFSVKSSRKVDGIHAIQLKTPLEADSAHSFEHMAKDDEPAPNRGQTPERITWKSAVKNGYAIVIRNAPRAAGPDVICLAPGRIFLSQICTGSITSLPDILREFRKMRESKRLLSLLRRCCMIESEKEEDVEVVCTLVVRRQDSVNLWRRREEGKPGLWYETDDLSSTNIREFFVAENGDTDSEFSSSFYPFMQTRDVMTGTKDAADHSVKLSNYWRLW